MSRTPIIAGNWKLHMNPEQTTEFVHPRQALYVPGESGPVYEPL